MTNFIVRISVLCFLGTLFSELSFADELEIHLRKLTTALKSNDLCSIAVLSIPKDPDDRKVQMLGRLVPWEVLCVGDLQVNPGTAIERKGCGFVVIDLRTLSTRPFMARVGHDYEFSEKSCEDGGFHELMNRKFQVPGQIGDKISRWFVKPELPEMQELVLLFTKNSTARRLLGKASIYEEWFEQHRSPKGSAKQKKGEKNEE